MNPADIRHAQFTGDSFGTQVVHEKCVIGSDQNFTQRSRENIVNFSQAFAHDGPLARVRAIEAGHENFTRIAVKGADTIFANEDGSLYAFTAFL